METIFNAAVSLENCAISLIGLLHNNPFISNAAFLYSLKTCCFQGAENWCIGSEWVKILGNITAWVPSKTFNFTQFVWNYYIHSTLNYVNWGLKCLEPISNYWYGKASTHMISRKRTVVASSFCKVPGFQNDVLWRDIWSD